jgi:hypothetical protein
MNSFRLSFCLYLISGVNKSLVPGRCGEIILGFGSQYLWIFILQLAVGYPPGVYNFEAERRFVENLWPLALYLMYEVFYIFF